MDANELANKLEQKAKELREHGLSKDDMDKIAGGGCECCGSSCQLKSDRCYGESDGSPRGAFCVRSCINTSAD